jgi:hypothetical protein
MGRPVEINNVSLPLAVIRNDFNLDPALPGIGKSSGQRTQQQPGRQQNNTERLIPSNQLDQPLHAKIMTSLICWQSIRYVNHPHPFP